MEATVIRVSEPRELLSYVPYAVGFRPRDSLVLMSLRKSRGRLGLLARVDLADLADLRDGPATAHMLAQHLRRDGAERTIASVWTDLSIARARQDAEVARAVRAVRRCQSMPRVEEIWLVASDGWTEWSGRREDCCPATGRPLRELESTVLGAAMVVAGAGLAPDREQLAPAPAPSGPRTQAAASALTRALARREAGASPQSAHERSYRRWHALIEAAGAREELDAGALGALAADLEDTTFRDGLLLSLVAQVEGADAEELGAERLLELAYTSGARAPERAELALVEAVLTQCARLAPPGHRAKALAALGWIAWWCGDGARASVLIDRALADDPPHAFARLMAQLIAGGLPPGWIHASRVEEADQ